MSSAARPTLLHPLVHSPTYLPSSQQPREQRGRDFSVYDEACPSAWNVSGLYTPPSEATMSTAYQNHHHAVLPYEVRGHNAFAREAGNLPSRMSVHSGSTGSDRVQSTQQHQVQHHSHGQSQVYSQPQYSLQHPHHVASHVVRPYSHSASSRQSTRPSTPASGSTSQDHADSSVLRRDSAMVVHSLELPNFISPKGGSLDEFAALMTCFFWFEKMETIQLAEQIKEHTTMVVSPLSPYARPFAAYKKWVHSILSTTQVTQNVVLLALMFVYRLKSTNPKVNGSPGSEYRLLTVALMLGNKFLDDNTYTNKTWAEVSGISVKEIHVMEVEFLSNMRYNLLASKEQWTAWLNKLGCFHEYYERAQNVEIASETAGFQPRVPMNLSNGSSSPHRDFYSPLPSPTSILPSSTPGALVSVVAVAPSGSSNSVVYGTYQPHATTSPLATRPALSSSAARKRSLDTTDVVEPAPKRPSRHVAEPMDHTRLATMANVRLPIPHLTLDTTQIATQQLMFPTSTSFTQAPVSLPPLGSGARAMATVFSSTQATSIWASQPPIMATSGPQTPSYPTPVSHGTPSKRHSPGSLAIFASSPLSEAYATHTPMSNSPSVYLQQRNSPYRPVRPVNTLNYPPPSVPLSEYHMGPAQMHYQPLGRRNVRTGIVPEFQHPYGESRPPSTVSSHPAVQQHPS